MTFERRLPSQMAQHSPRRRPNQVRDGHLLSTHQFIAPFPRDHHGIDANNSAFTKTRISTGVALAPRTDACPGLEEANYAKSDEFDIRRIDDPSIWMTCPLGVA